MVTQAFQRLPEPATPMPAAVGALFRGRDFNLNERRTRPPRCSARHTSLGLDLARGALCIAALPHGLGLTPAFMVFCPMPPSLPHACPRRSVDTLKLEEIWAVKNKPGSRVLTAKVLASLHDKPPSLGVQVGVGAEGDVAGLPAHLQIH